MRSLIVCQLNDRIEAEPAWLHAVARYFVLSSAAFKRFRRNGCLGHGLQAALLARFLMGTSKQILEWPSDDQDDVDRIQMLGQLAYDLTVPLLAHVQTCADMCRHMQTRCSAISLWLCSTDSTEDAVTRDGWCCIRMNDDALVRDAAILEARSLSNFALCQKVQLQLVRSMTDCVGS